MAPTTSRPRGGSTTPASARKEHAAGASKLRCIRTTRATTTPRRVGLMTCSGVRDQEIRAALDQHWAASDANDLEAEHRVYHEDAVLEYPQSGERTRGRRNIQNQRASQPSNKRFAVRRIIATVIFGSPSSSDAQRTVASQLARRFPLPSGSPVRALLSLADLLWSGIVQCRLLARRQVTGQLVQERFPVGRYPSCGPGYRLTLGMRMRRKQRHTLDHPPLLEIEEPVLTRLETGNDRMPGRGPVLGCMLARRTVAATDVTTLRAPTEMKPPAFR